MQELILSVRENGIKQKHNFNEIVRKFYLSEDIPDNLLTVIKPVLYSNTVAMFCQLISLSEFRFDYYSKHKIFPKILNNTDLEELSYSFRKDVFPYWVNNPEQKEKFTLFMIRKLMEYNFNKDEYRLLLDMRDAISEFIHYMKEYSAISKKARREIATREAINFYKKRENKLIGWYFQTKKWVFV